MNTKKRILSILLALVIVLGLLPPETAWAAGSDLTTENSVFSEYSGSSSDMAISEKAPEYASSEKRKYIGGPCGNNVTWQFVYEDDENGLYTLYIRGNGDMFNFDHWESVPWYGDREHISNTKLQ